MPQSCLETFVRFFFRDFPERFHRGLAVASLLPRSVECRRTGIDEVQDAARRRAGELVAGDALDGVGTPVSADVRKNLRGVRKQIIDKHRSAVETIVLRRDNIWRADAVPVE